MPRIRTFLLPTLCGLLALLFAGLACYQIEVTRLEALDRRFAVSAASLGRELQAQLDDGRHLLIETAAYRDTAPGADLGAFLKAYLGDHAPAGLRSLSLAPLVLPEGREAFLATQRARLGTDFAIHPDVRGPLSAPVILSLGPSGQLGLVAGQDLMSDLEQQQTLASARDSGVPAISGGLQLTSRAGEHAAGFIEAAPFFLPGAASNNPVERRISIEGWFVAAFEFRAWVGEALSKQPAGLAVSLSVGEPGATLAALHDSADPTTAIAGLQPLNIPLRFGERQWTARVFATPAFVADDSNPARRLAPLGVVFAALIFFLTMHLATDRRRQILEAARLQENLAESEERWRFALESSGDGVWDWDIRTGKVSFSPHCDTILGMGNGKAAQARIHPDDEVRERAAMQACLEGRTTQYESEHRMQGDDGHWRWIVARGMVTARTLAGAAARMVGTISDITARKEAEEVEQNLARIDSLTGLPNRTLFFDRLQQALRLIRRKREPLALIHADIDGFKQLNDNFGSGFCNKLLQELAFRLSDAIRESDTVGHLGQDDFAILLPALTNEADIHIVIDKIRAALAAEIVINNRHITITLSYGVALFPQHARTAESLLNGSLRAMQQAQKSGGDAVVFSLAPAEKFG